MDNVICLHNELHQIHQIVIRQVKKPFIISHAFFYSRVFPVNSTSTSPRPPKKKNN